MQLSARVARAGGLDLHWLPLQSLARATVQLSLVALILRGVLDAPALIAAFIALMLTTASLTASGRIAGLHRGRRVAVAGVLAGAAAALLVIFALRLVDTDGTYVIAVAGIVIGNSMTAATLAGRMVARAAQERRGGLDDRSDGPVIGRKNHHVPRFERGRVEVVGMDEARVVGAPR